MNKIDIELGVASCENFSSLYPALNKAMVEKGKLEASRNGGTIELLNFKTIIKDPTKRCVGGYGRGINIFFLLSEAIWIWLGKKDVSFLEFFNSQMKEYSDNGETFHAPYGYRLRQWSKPSDNIFIPDKIYAENDVDQIKLALKMLSTNSQDRRVVMSIWNPLLDLAVKSKDLPCNDMVMLKIRDGRLYLTVQNRSNDLHWGLPTNVFQFSFIGEIMAAILGVKLGDQVHNSQSLHIYTHNHISINMLNGYAKRSDFEYYSGVVKNHPMKFSFEESMSVEEKLKKVDFILEAILIHLSELMLDKSYRATKENLRWDTKGSTYFEYVCKLLCIYISYKHSKKTDEDKLYHSELVESISYNFHGTDISYLATAFFLSRLTKKPDQFLHNEQVWML